MKNFQDRIRSIYGEKGNDWLLRLPAIIEYLIRTWNLGSVSTINNLTYNYVASALTKDGTTVMLKVCFDYNVWHNQTSALEIFNGHGSVMLIAKNAEYHAMLLEAAQPGTSLKSYFPESDNEASVIAANVINKLHSNQPKAITVSLQKLDTWIRALYNQELTKILPKEHVYTAQKLSSELIASQSQQIILHADLHHDNILMAQRESWLAIDPHGVVGEAAYEPGAFIRNPSADRLTRQIITYRIDAFSDILNLDRNRISAWTYVQAVLSVCWSIEDNMEYAAGLALCNTLKSFL